MLIARSISSCRSTAAGGCGRVGGARAHGQPKRVQRLMRQMDLRALYPRLEPAGQGTQDLPLPAQGLERANQAWASDISYIPMAKGFMYGGDHGRYSRRVLSWRVSNTLDTDFCIRWRKRALKRRRSSIPTKGPSTCEAFTDVLKDHAIAISWMARADGWTTCSSNVCGAASSTRTCTCGPTKRPPSFGQDWPATSVSTTPGAVTAHWTDAPPMRCTSTSPRFGSLKPEEDSTYRTVQFPGSISAIMAWLEMRMTGWAHRSGFAVQ